MVYYVAFYNPQNEVGKRVANYAGEDKIDYICESIIKTGGNVTLLSNTKSISRNFLKKKVYMESDNKKIVMFSSLPHINVAIHAVDVLYGYIQLALYLLTHLKKGDVVLVYHSLGYRNFFKSIRKIKKFKYILEVEELYQYIDMAKSSFKTRENSVFGTPDAFIFSNEVLKNTVNSNNKPGIVINGIYKNQHRLVIKKESSITKVVYAGSLEKQKGVDFVVKVAEYLDDRFELRIIGFGSDNDKCRIDKLIKAVLQKTCCRITYEGVLKGDEYNAYIQSCDIGICIQDPNDKFNLYEFPSKIFSYMSNGLNVVVNRLDQIEKSEIANHVTIVNGTEPQMIALAIKKAAMKKEQVTDVLNRLDEDFIKNLAILLKEITKDDNE